MESIQSESAPSKSIPFKSKKPLLTTTTTPKKKPPPPPSPSSAIVTPEKSNPPVTRIRNQNFALSVSDIRQTALKLRKPNSIGSDLHGPVTENLVRHGSADAKPKSSEKSATLLPEKYEMLCEFFNAMVSSIRLLRLKRLTPTFTKLCRNIESLTDRRFTLHHLAQLKHVMPEVIVVEKIRVQDEETKCMKEELMLKLEVDAVESDKNVKRAAGFSQLKGIFQSRITNYSTTHSEVDDIPEGDLPQLFYHRKQDHEQSKNEMPTSLAASHISPSFKSRFSSKGFSASIPDSSPAEPSSCLLETPIKEASSTRVEDGSSCTTAKIQGTPVELASTPAKLMSATPALRPPKRSLMSPDHGVSDLPSDSSAKRSRSLRFDESPGDLEDQVSIVDDEDDVPVQCSVSSKDVSDMLPESLLQSLKERERRILQEQDPVVSQARRRQQLMAGVPKLFDMIRLLFQSIRRSIITKEELIHKIVAGNLDIVDRKEVEEQLKLLQEVAPEYISEQLCLSGDILIRLNKSSNPESVRAKLVDAQ